MSRNALSNSSSVPRKMQMIDDPGPCSLRCHTKESQHPFPSQVSPKDIPAQLHTTLPLPPPTTLTYFDPVDIIIFSSRTQTSLTPIPKRQTHIPERAPEQFSPERRQRVSDRRPRVRDLLPAPALNQEMGIAHILILKTSPNPTSSPTTKALLSIRIPS